MVQFKPTLFPNEKPDLNKIKFPLLASTKLDGIRCIFKDGQMLSRSLKEIPNKQLQDKFKNLKEYSLKYNMILDGEIYGERMTFQQITHYVMTDDLESEILPENLKFYCFDALSNMNTEIDFTHRIKSIPLFENLVSVKQVIVNSKVDVDNMFDDVIASGFEGIILKNPFSKYKFGRFTLKSGDGFKVKPYETFDAEVIGIEERFENLNESMTNELGHSFKRNTIDAKKGTGLAATFIVKYNNEEQRVCITGTEEFRRNIWNNKKDFIGKWIEYKGMVLGSVNKIRHPVYLRMRYDK